jgi:trans-2,3-dihydro-3-hydroxyanthranilate isomerase
MLSLAEGEVLEGAACWSCGVPFLVVPVAGADALSRCALDLPRLRELLASYPTQKVYPVARIGELHWRVRMFAPGLGVAEDPATGSAAAAFAGWLARELPQPRDGTAAVRLEQGVEMGRPAELHVEFDRRAGAITAVRVGGAAVMVAEGTLAV